MAHRVEGLNAEVWANRADLAEQAINERHARPLWGLPRTNLARVAWPATARERYFIRWHYWWQAHYLDCLIDAALRRPTTSRQRRISHTIRAMRIRHLRKLTANRYYDDKAWLALALGRLDHVKRMRSPRLTSSLEKDLALGVDSLTGALPWRRGETFYNVPTNGPAAIMFARTGQVDEALTLIEWLRDNLLNEDRLLADGLRLRMHGPEIIADVHPYCQGVALGACVEVLNRAGINRLGEEQRAQLHVMVRNLVEAIAKELATPQGVLTGATGGGDGGLFKGILARYLALVATNLPESSSRDRATRRLAARLVVASAESVWAHRLEVDGLPVFSSDWTADARLPRNSGVLHTTRPTILAGSIQGSDVPERDLSVQLSGWMLLEAAAKVVAHQEAGE